MKKSTKHNLYEIWNELDADSIFCEGKPTRDELFDICKKNEMAQSSLDGRLPRLLYGYVYKKLCPCI